MRGLSTVMAPGDRLGRPWEIILIESDDHDRQSLAEALAAMHCNVLAARSVDEALPELTTPDRVFDAVVTDIAGDGGTASVGLLATAARTPIVVYADGADDALVGSALAAGASTVVDRAEGPGALVMAFARGDLSRGADLAALPESSRDLAGTTDFPTMLRRVLTDLRQRIPLALWMFTRIEGDDWIVVDAVGEGYGIQQGSVLNWSESVCSRMVRGQGPRVVHDLDALPVYTDAPVVGQVPIGCYVGMPIALEGRGLFGTLCAIDPSPADPDLQQHEWLLEVLARTLSSTLAIELERAALDRRLREGEERDIDPLTGLATKQTWTRLLRLEEARSARTGEHAAVVVFDVAGLSEVNRTHGYAAGDATLRRAAQAVRQCVGIHELGVRLGGDKFGIMAVGRTPEAIDQLAEELSAALTRAGISAVMGLAGRGDGITLADASLMAMDLMAREKSRRHSSVDGED